jgi:hypothetical protein
MGSETVAFRGTNTAGTAISSSQTTIPFSSERDSHGAWGGSEYTVPISGWYRISVTLQTSSYSISNSQVLYAVIRKNGSDYAFGPREIGNGTANIRSCSADTAAYFVVGDKISIQSATDVGTTLRTNAGTNYLSITKSP